jgi:CubicO group peptidase (beta-lactamase class C family)
MVLVPADRPITIHHLLTHTSGLTYRFIGNPLVGPLYVESGVSDGLAETPGTIGDNVKRLARLPLIFQPGTRWEYSLATDVLGRVIEAASGRTFDRFLRERMFDPLKMKDTHFVVPPDSRDRLAAVYYPGPGGPIRRMPATPVQVGPLVYSANFPSFETGTYYSGGAGLTSTIDDYARFLQMILNKGELDGVRVLKADTVATMTRDQIAPLDPPIWGVGDGFSYGFGVVRPGNHYKDPAGVGALSWTGFFGTYFWLDVEHQVIAIYMAQAPTVPDVQVGPTFKRLTYEALLDR